MNNTEWISLKEKLPEPNQPVLWYDKMFDTISLHSLPKPELYDADYTHWMLLPESPKF